MNSALTRPQSLQELYKTYFSFANKFHFTDLLRNYIQNEEWKDKSQQPVWDLLSKISDDIGAVLTDDIVNYTRNVVDVNTCKVPQLIEQAWMLSYHLDHLKNTYAFFPKRIQVLVDLFSVNPEYLIGNHKNHILSDKVIKEILLYIREHVSDRTLFNNETVLNKLLADPHGLVDDGTYSKFVHILFYVSLVEALSASYSGDSDSDQEPIVFNLLWEERQNQSNILSRLDEYRSWVDKYIWNEIEYPLNDSGLSNTVYSLVEQVKNQKQMSSKFNPFKVADHIWFNGLNPTNELSGDELDLVQTVLDYHAKTKYDYQRQQFVDDMSTQYAYYRELEWCEYVKLVMYVMNNIRQFGMKNLSYDPGVNKFIQLKSGSTDCIRTVRIFSQGNCVVQNSRGGVALDHGVISRVAEFLRDFSFLVRETRENIKTIAHKHAMRGSCALLVHMVNDFLMKELPIVRDMVQEQNPEYPEFKFLWEMNPELRRHGNVRVLEYDDDNEYFNIDPSADVRFTARTNARYWEQLEGMSDSDSLGVLTKGQIKDFYRNVLGMGRLQHGKPSKYDDVCDFLVDLFRIGANPIEWKNEEGEFYNPIDDIMYDSEEKYGYTKQERLEVQNNVELRKNQEKQFLEYSGSDDLIGDSIYDYANNRIFYWKNRDYSSHVLHPFMYNLKLWNKLNNIIINGYKDYADSDFIDYLSSKVKFDELFGKFGEGRNFWKYNLMDLTGYTTRYEASVKDEHTEDFNSSVSPLTGYDGLFYPEAARDFLELMDSTQDFGIPEWFFKNPDQLSESEGNRRQLCFSENPLTHALYSVYWQMNPGIDGKSGAGHEFYTKWYSHLNYTRAEYQKMAIQLWYWRDRIRELITTEYPITKYCLDVQGNSLIMVQTFRDGEEETNPYLIDLAVAQNKVQQAICGNRNTHVSFCEDRLRKPSELWIRWKSNPIALPAFDVYYDEKSGDRWFDFHYRDSQSVEFGQLTHTNSQCNEWFKLVLLKWREDYRNVVHWNDGAEEAKPLDKNRLPVFFDMEQSANVLVLASWYKTPDVDSDGIVNYDTYGNPLDVTCCGKNPLHILSIERTSETPSEYSFSEYTQDPYLVNPRNMTEWMFDTYHYCQANGSLLVPLYNFDCQDGSEPKQVLKMRMFVVPAQMLKQDNNATTDRISVLGDYVLDLNQKVDFDGSRSAYRFNNPMKVCRNTNVAFSVADVNGLNKVKCAFLGTFQNPDEYGSDSQKYRQFKVSSCDAQTRYEYDSQTTTDLGLTKGKYFSENGNLLGENKNYIDDRVSGECFNSYDSNDKYVFVVDIQPSIDLKNLIDTNWSRDLRTYSYNILSDAGYIPHFAYQSLMRYGENDRLPHENGDMPDGGIAFTWRNAHLDRKDHMQFELLGLDDKEIPESYRTMLKMVVEDTSDDCKTLLCPAKLMDDIYRIWCENEGMKRRLLPGEEDKYGYKAKYDSHFKGEYSDYPNPLMSWNDAIVGADGAATLTWTVQEEDNSYFEIEVPDIDAAELTDEQQQLREINAYREVLDQYYVSIVRTDNGNIINEKRYILPPTKMSEIILDNCTTDGYYKCNLSEYISPQVEGNHFSPAQVVFTGTRNPFRYDEDGERILSKPEELQYGNGVKGVQSIELKIDVIDEGEQFILKRDDQGNAIIRELEKVVEVLDENGKVVNRKIEVISDQSDRYGRNAPVKKVVPTVRFTKFTGGTETLNDRINSSATSIAAGQITVILSRKNPNDIAKYHILNRYGSLYFSGSLPKNGQNQFKYSDFKFGQTVHLVKDSEWWKSTEVDEDGQHVLQFQDRDVHGQSWTDAGNPYEIPPYYVDVTRNGEVIRWFLEQDQLNPRTQKHSLEKGSKTPDNSTKMCHVSFQENGVRYPIPDKGNWKMAHKVKAKAEKYIDYLYVKNGGLSFKISEESESFADAMSKIPPFHIDEVMRNKLEDLNDVKVMKEYSTFIHQSEKPQRVNDCQNFNPMLADVMLNYGLEQEELGNVQESDPKVICTEGHRKNSDGTAEPITQKVIELDNSTNLTRLNLQLDDGEVDDCLKIYTNYVRVPDDHGDFHYDLYFNVQNLFNSPFEYISTVTNQPNVLILPDSYLYLPGDKYKKGYDGNGQWTHNEIDDEKVDAIKQGGELVLYGQMKTYSGEVLSDVKTVKLFAYRIWNISDDKPKFLIKKTYDITKSRIKNGLSRMVDIRFSDVMWTIDENQYVFLDDEVEYDMDNQFKELNRDVIVVQPVDIRYNWNKDDDYRINQISFDIVNDVIDFSNTPELCEYWIQTRTLRNGDGRVDSNGNHVDKNYPYYDHWSDRYMKLEFNEDTKIPRLTLTHDSDSGFNFERIYLRWRLPKGCRIMDTIDRLGGYVFSSTAQNVVVECNNRAVVPEINVNTGYVTSRVHRPGEMYLGIEHSTAMRKNGYVLTGLKEKIEDALFEGKTNPTLREFTITEQEIRIEAANERV